MNSFVLDNAANLETIGRGAFVACNALASIAIGELSPNFAVFDGVVYSEDKKKLVAYPCGRVNTNGLLNDITTIETRAFAYCTSIKQIDLSGMHSLTSLESEAFSNMVALTSFVLHDAANFRLLSDNVFDSCQALESVIIHNPSQLESLASTDLSSIGTLTSVVLPSSVTALPMLPSSVTYTFQFTPTSIDYSPLCKASIRSIFPYVILSLAFTACSTGEYIDLTSCGSSCTIVKNCQLCTAGTYADTTDNLMF